MSDLNWSGTYLLGLRSLVLLPLSDLSGQLLDNGGDIGLVHRGVDLDLGEVLDDTNVEVELLGGGRAAVGVALLTLLALLAASADEVVVLVLLQDLHALHGGVINGTANLSTELRGLVLFVIQSQSSEVVGRVEVADKTLGGKDLVGVSQARGLLELLVGNLLLLLALEGVPLGLLLLPANSPGLILVLLVCLASLVVGVLDLTDSSPLLLLLTVELGALVPQGVEVLESAVLLGLDGIQLLLNLGVLVAQSLGLRVVKGLLEGGNLGLDVVDDLLGLIQAGEVLTLLAQAGDIGKGLLLIHQAHGTGINLLLEARDFTVNLLDTLERHAGLGVVLLRNAGLERAVQSIDLLLCAGPGRLESRLLLTDGGELSTEFLLSLSRGRVLVVGLGGLDLGLDLVLYEVSNLLRQWNAKMGLEKNPEQTYGGS